MGRRLLSTEQAMFFAEYDQLAAKVLPVTNDYPGQSPFLITQIDTQLRTHSLNFGYHNESYKHTTHFAHKRNKIRNGSTRKDQGAN